MSHTRRTIPSSLVPHVRAYRDELERDASDLRKPTEERAGYAYRAFVATWGLDHGFIDDHDTIKEMLAQHDGLTEVEAANIMSQMRGAIDQMPFQDAV
jgi:hypothetical protein